MSGENEAPQWPPRSPYEAFMTSPSSKRKLQQRTSRLSPSPSPLKKSATTPNRRRARLTTPPAFEEEGEEEDEETLQLQLQALEAKLKLKRLQSRKVKDTGSDSESGEIGSRSIPRTTARARSVLSTHREELGGHGQLGSRSITDVQVPLSPDKRKTTVAQEPRSPGRVLLGIDKGLSGRNVSLRRPPGSRPNDDPFASNTINAGATPGASLSKHASIGRGLGKEVGKSFNDRIAESRDREKRETDHKERIQQLRKQRSTGFGIQDHELEQVKATTVQEQEHLQATRQRKLETGFSREDVLRGVNKPDGGLVRRSNTLSGVRNTRHDSTLSVETFSRPKSAASTRLQTQDRPASQISQASSTSSDPSTAANPAGDPSLFEPYSSTNLSRRILPHTFLKRTLEDKTPVLIPTLLQEVKAPAFELPPDLESANLVLFASIASKSSPINHKETHRTQSHDQSTRTTTQEAQASRENERGKFMVLTLTDLKWTLDLFLFSSAYTRWSKLTPGTLVAILNPDIMPPPRHKLDTGRWSLTLNSEEDTILEIGTNKDLGWCKAVRKDGSPCSDWVDKRKTDFCEFHVDAGVERHRKGRMEVQGVGAGFAPGGKRGGRHGFFGSGRAKGGSSKVGEPARDAQGRWMKGDGLRKEGKQYDRGAHSEYFIAFNNTNRTAASLLDANEDGDRGGREERMRKMFADQEREKQIAQRLGSGGNGAGAEYLRVPEQRAKARAEDKRAALRSQAGSSSMDTTSDGFDQRDATSLGLKGNSAASVMLSPLKRKRSTTDGVAKKKTRFVTAKGIREAGRESLPGPMQEDDDGLDII